MIFSNFKCGALLWLGLGQPHPGKDSVPAALGSHGREGGDAECGGRVTLREGVRTRGGPREGAQCLQGSFRRVMKKQLGKVGKILDGRGAPRHSGQWDRMEAPWCPRIPGS